MRGLVISKMATLVVRRILNKSLFFGPSAACLSAKLRLFSNQAAIWTTEKFDEVVKKDKVVVFMKGVPEQPMCGFSNAVVQILRMHGVEGYGTYNVLEDEELRQGVKDYSSWPTVPQVYIGGEFIGGCDIMLQLHQQGELIEELQKVGIRSLLLDKADDEKKDT
ncbi:glutaredoxin-related protein 5, mitochondrial-like [Stylophora pistillata]|uniref:glutaredoxin-related protein 5, mitochondrial-like n=1 Tax=Stylophora pistillata TaxID=50429 RepID=UPI000C043177|nr:glutaredoxin-related protein 5, mitochondrial-like [Stylophora pistillata]